MSLNSTPVLESSRTESDSYFTSYNDVNVHELMVKDRPRTLAYKKFFEDNREYVKDKVVMDVGSGTGILAMFAAAAGAKKVYAVEASGIAEICEHIVECNGFKNKIQVIPKCVEDVELPNGELVDIIVSEWMGFYLLHESMLDSVIFARDKFLKPDGIMVPSHANMIIAPVNMDRYYDDHFDFWSNCYGFDLSPMIASAMTCAMKEPLITEVSENQILSEPDYVVAFDLKTVTLDDVSFVEKSCMFTANSSCIVHGFATWFNTVFMCPTSETEEEKDDESVENLSKIQESVEGRDTTLVMPVTLGTGPQAEMTHWKQTVIMLPSPVELDKGSNLPCLIQLSQDEDNKRQYNISIQLSESSEEDESDTNDHPVPCDCSSARCRLIKAVMERYEEEQDEIENEALNTETNAEIEAARVLDAETISDISL